MAGIDIRISPKHLSSGKLEDCECCPIALAARDALRGLLGQGRSIWVDRNTIKILRKRHIYEQPVREYRLPAVARHWQEAFDRGKDIEPIAFYAEEIRPDEVGKDFLEGLDDDVGEEAA